MNKPHKHVELIKAWADGAQIQILFNSTGEWADNDHPDWYPNYIYRIKPQPVVQKMYMHYDNIERHLKEGRLHFASVPQLTYDSNYDMGEHLEFTFTDGKLTNVEMKNAAN